MACCDLGSNQLLVLHFYLLFADSIGSETNSLALVFLDVSFVAEKPRMFLVTRHFSPVWLFFSDFIKGGFLKFSFPRLFPFSGRSG